jgi:SAM-dependent methyltransferase
MKYGSRQSSSFESYSALAKAEKNATVRVGRRPEDASKEPAIWSDMVAKVRVARGERGLDIGCGSGVLAKLWCEEVQAADLTLTLIDFPAPLARLRQELTASELSRVELVAGGFPDDLPSPLPAESYDFIVMYSVIHYADDPMALIDPAVALLRPGGRLLVGDIPNFSRKGRFLATPAGRAFDAEYHDIPVSDAPYYKTHQEFVAAQRASGTVVIDDAIMLHKVAYWRDRGMDVYILPQPASLPFSFTREDLLIVRPGA